MPYSILTSFSYCGDLFVYCSVGDNIGLWLLGTRLLDDAQNSIRLINMCGDSVYGKPARVHLKSVVRVRIILSATTACLYGEVGIMCTPSGAAMCVAISLNAPSPSSFMAETVQPNDL